MLQRSARLGALLRQRSVGDRVGVDAVAERAGLLQAQTESASQVSQYTKPFGSTRGRRSRWCTINRKTMVKRRGAAKNAHASCRPDTFGTLTRYGNATSTAHRLPQRLPRAPFTVASRSARHQPAPHSGPTPRGRRRARRRQRDLVHVARAGPEDPGVRRRARARLFDAAHDARRARILVRARAAPAGAADAVA